MKSLLRKTMVMNVVRFVIEKLKLLPYRLFALINEHAEMSSPPYELFSWYFIFSYPLYYLVWSFQRNDGYESFTLRFVVVILCVPLLFKDKWPLALKKYLNLYWYFMLSYSLPFLFTFLLLKNEFQYIEVLNTMSVWALSILLFDAFSFILFFPAAIVVGVLAFHLTSPGPIMLPDDFQAIVICYLSVFLSGLLFAFRKDIVKEKRKTEALTTMIATIAHEVRTPMATIKNSALGIKQYLPDLIRTYQMAKEANLGVPVILPKVLKTLEKASVNISSEANTIFLLIDVFLANFQQDHLLFIKKDKFSMQHLLEAALSRFPLTDEQRAHIHLEIKEDFFIIGSDKVIEYIIFNLLRNALYYMAEAAKGEIFIRLEKGKKRNTLYFKDTGLGIAKDKLPYIFQPFYTDRHHGTGMGLSFCKSAMLSCGGEISCRSVLGEYTEFVLRFPTVV